MLSLETDFNDMADAVLFDGCGGTGSSVGGGGTMIGCGSDSVRCGGG